MVNWNWSRTLLKGVLALSIGFVGSGFFIYFGLALPWVLGSILACAVASLLGASLQLPGAWRGYAMAALGVVLGSSFTAETAQLVPQWLPTLSVMLLITVLYSFLSYQLLKRWSGMDSLTSLFAAVPGGLSVVSAIADAYNADTRRIALSHSARLVALLSLTPILLHYIGGYELGNPPTPTESSESTQLSWDHLHLIGCGLGGWLLAKKMKFPTGMLLFPLLASAVLHSTNISTALAPPSIASLAQLIIGTSVGVRFAGYSIKTIMKDGWLSIIIGLLLAAVALIATLIMQWITGMPFGPLLLVFLPGGAPEIGVMALALNIDPAMVTTHHMLRVLFLMVGVGLLTQRIHQFQK